MSWIELFDLSDALKTLTEDMNSGASRLRDEAYAEKFDYCKSSDKNVTPTGLSMCSTPEGDIVYESSDLGRLVVKPDHTSAQVKPNGAYIYRNAAGEVTYLEYPNGKLRTFEYDTAGNLIGWTEPDGSSMHKVTDQSGQQRWQLTHPTGIKQTASVTSAEVNEAGNLTWKTPSSTRVYTTDGHTIGISGDESVETDADGRVVKQGFAMGSREYHYGKDGCLDAIKMTSTSISVKDGDEWGAYSTTGNRFALTMVDAANYDKYSSLPQGCRVTADGEGIDVLDTPDGKVVSIQDKDGKETLLNFDKAGQLVRVETTSSTLYKRDELIWRAYRGDGSGEPIETLSFRDMDFKGLDKPMDLLECLSQAQLHGL